MSDPFSVNDLAEQAQESVDVSRRQFGALSLAGLVAALPAVAAAAQADTKDAAAQTSGDAPAGGILPGEMRTLKLVPTEPTPKDLVVCSARIRSDVALALNARFNKGEALPTDVKSKYGRHLSYMNGLTGKLYEAGPSADFTEILYIYNTGSLAEAKALMQADPFHREGVFHDDTYFNWSIHSPSYKSTSSATPEQVKEVSVDLITPEWLIVALGTANSEVMLRWAATKGVLPLPLVMHVYNMFGPGGLQQMGVAWAAGPSNDFSKILQIFAVPTVEMGKFFNESEALYRWGAMKDFRYFEWCIHYPFKKACPRQKTLLSEAMKDAGVVVQEA